VKVFDRNWPNPRIFFKNIFGSSSLRERVESREEKGEGNYRRWKCDLPLRVLRAFAVALIGLPRRSEGEPCRNQLKATGSGAKLDKKINRNTRGLEKLFQGNKRRENINEVCEGGGQGTPTPALPRNTGGGGNARRRLKFL